MPASMKRRSNGRSQANRIVAIDPFPTSPGAELGRCMNYVARRKPDIQRSLETEIWTASRTAGRGDYGRTGDDSIVQRTTHADYWRSSGPLIGGQGKLRGSRRGPLT